MSVMIFTKHEKKEKKGIRIKFLKFVGIER